MIPIACKITNFLYTMLVELAARFMVFLTYNYTDCKKFHKKKEWFAKEKIQATLETVDSS